MDKKDYLEYALDVEDFSCGILDEEKDAKLKKTRLRHEDGQSIVFGLGRLDEIMADLDKGSEPFDLSGKNVALLSYSVQGADDDSLEVEIGSASLTPAICAICSMYDKAEGRQPGTTTEKSCTKAMLDMTSRRE